MSDNNTIINIFFYGLGILFLLSLVCLYLLGFFSLVELLIFSSIFFICTICFVESFKYILK